MIKLGIIGYPLGHSLSKVMHEAVMKELGMDGIAVTDHGTLSVIEDLRRSFKAEGLKLIPGCEVYIDGGVAGRKHLVLLAKNDNGYFKGVSKVVTVSNYHLP